MSLVTSLRNLIRRHRRRMAVCMVIAAIGSLLLYLGVIYLKLEPWLANMVLSPLMTVAAFFATKHFVWPDRQVPYSAGLIKWVLKWGMFAPISQTAFAVLTERYGLHFLAARVAVGGTLGLPSYIINNKLIFTGWGQRLVQTVRRGWILMPWWRLKAEKA